MSRTAAPNFMRGALDVLDLDLAATALVVVDMQNDFVRQGAPLEVPTRGAPSPAIGGC